MRKTSVDRIHGERFAPPRELVANIRKYGIIHPLILQRNGTGYRIVCGRKRFAAAVWAGLEEVPSIILPEDADADMITLSENFHRDSSPAIEAEIFNRLITNGMTEADIAHELNISQGKVSQRIGLLRLVPDLFERLRIGTLRPSVARELATMSESDQRQVMEGELTLGAVREFRRTRKLEAINSIPEGSIPEPPEREPRRCPHCGREI